MAGKLWDKGYEPDKMIEEYTVGDDRELDMRLARYDVEGSLADSAAYRDKVPTSVRPPRGRRPDS